MQSIKKAGYSKVPVLEGDAVLGLFSYRSLAEGIMRMGKTRMAVGDLPVEEFVGKTHFWHATNERDMIFDWVDRDNAVLIGGNPRTCSAAKIRAATMAIVEIRFSIEARSRCIIAQDCGRKCKRAQRRRSNHNRRAVTKSIRACENRRCFHRPSVRSCRW